MRSAEHSPVRIDPATGTAHEALWFGPDAQLFGIMSRPHGDARGAVVMCPSLHVEFAKSYRRESVLARLIAAEGLAVLRFQYRGTGNSWGDPRQLTYDTMIDDIREAAVHLGGAIGVAVSCIVGVRVASLPATAASVSFRDAGLVLWAPLLHGGEYFQDMSRSEGIARLNRDEVQIERSVADRLADTASIELLGHEVTRDLYASLVDRRLEELGRDRSAPALFLQFSRRAEVRPGLAAVAQAWRAAGQQVSTAVCREEIAWSLTEDATGSRDSLANLDAVEETRDWIVALHTEAARDAAH